MSPQLRGIGIDQNLGQQLPADLVFRNEAGQPVRLGDYFGRRPMILTLVYYNCPMLCTLVLNDTLRAVRPMPLNLGDDFDILTISFAEPLAPQRPEHAQVLPRLPARRIGVIPSRAR
jgi:protein SCO1/2